MRNFIYHSAHQQAIKLGTLLVCLSLLVIYGDWTWRWDRLIYDVQSGLIKHQASDDIVIIAIDETSLNNIGRWPWSRRIHAQLIDKLNQHDVRAIVFDVIFSEPSQDDLEADALLYNAIKANGNVTLPILLEQSRLRGYLIETLPLPELTQAAATLGHVHIELDADGIARGSYMYEGLSEAYWPHIGMSLWKLLKKNITIHSATEARPESLSNSPWNFHRRDPFMIPFVGPPGSYQTTSYINILNDDILAGTLKNKIVLIGVTASGLGDSLPTPVSGLTRPMSGIEINANIIQAIQSNTLIYPIKPVWHYLIISLLVFFPVFLLSYLTPRTSLLLILAIIASTFFGSLISLHWLNIWMPITAAIVSLVLAYPLWAWRRLEFAVHYFDTELELLLNESKEIQELVTESSGQSLEFIQNLIPVTGISIYNTSKKELVVTHGNIEANYTDKYFDINWHKISNNYYGRNITINDNLYNILIHWKPDTHPDEQQTKILKIYTRQFINNHQQTVNTTVEFIESRILDIKMVTDKLSYLRHFLSDSLNQMADGIIVINSLGIITLANHQAARFVGTGANTPLLHKSILPILELVKITDNFKWESIILSVLLNKHYKNLQIRTQTNKDLIVNISPLHASNSRIIGFIINLSDITEIKNAQRRRNEVLGFLSHDLRSPLVSALAILEQDKSGHKQNDSSIRIEHNINRTIQLAEDFVHLTRVEGDDDIVFSEIDLADVIANAVDTVWDQANSREIEIEQQIIDNIWIKGNGSILERVFINLLSNAIKYSGGKSKIIITTQLNDSTFVCCIKDYGTGIPAHNIPCLFDRFQSTPQKQPGIGLGLAFVYAAMVKHQGSVDVSSEQGQGSTFCIRLPVDLNKP